MKVPNKVSVDSGLIGGLTECDVLDSIGFALEDAW